MTSTTNVRYLVCNENTLCYEMEGTSMLGVLAGKPRLYGRNWINGPFTPSPLDKLRPATSNDFDDFRVVQTNSG